MKFMTALCSLLVIGFNPVCADQAKDAARKELRTVYTELSATKKEYNRIVSDIRKAKHPELLAIEKKMMVSINPVNKAIEEHPDLAAIRARRDKAKEQWQQAVKAKDQIAAQTAVKERSKAKNDLYKAAYKHKDIIPLIKAREEIGKQRELVKKKLVAEKDPALVTKLDALEKRKAELRKIIYGK